MIAIFMILAGAVQSAPYPAEEVLSEFRQVCITQPSGAAIVAAAEQRGWRSFTPEAGSTLARTLETSSRLFASINLTPQMPSYWKDIGGRRLEMVVVQGRVPFEGQPRNLINCVIYDFSARRPIETQRLRAWAGRDPTNQGGDQGFIETVWTPGLAALPSETRIAFVPDTLAYRAEFPFTGIALVSDVFEQESE